MRIFLVIIFLTVLNLTAVEVKFEVKDNFTRNLLKWFENIDKAQIDELSAYKASKIAEMLFLHSTELEQPMSFKEALQNFNPADSSSGEQYLLRKAYRNRAALRKLLNLMQKINKKEVLSKALDFFPDDYKPNNSYEVFYNLVGWKWGDAMQFRYKEENEQIFLSDSGKIALTFNITLINDFYGNTLNKKIQTFKKVLPHELFHALYSDYIDSKPDYPQIDTAQDFLKYTMLNEGIAHYISLREIFTEKYNDNFKSKEKVAFDLFEKRVKKLNNPQMSRQDKMKLINQGTFGDFWKKDACIVGMFMAFHIENELGIEKLRSCIKSGFDSFSKTYNSINKDLPKLPEIFHLN